MHTKMFILCSFEPKVIKVGPELQEIEGFDIIESMFCIHYSSGLIPQHLILLLKSYNMSVYTDSSSLQCKDWFSLNFAVALILPWPDKESLITKLFGFPSGGILTALHILEPYWQSAYLSAARIKNRVRSMVNLHSNLYFYGLNQKSV